MTPNVSSSTPTQNVNSLTPQISQLQELQKRPPPPCDLPEEVWVRILQYIKLPQDRSAIMRAGKFFREICEGPLFNRIQPIVQSVFSGPTQNPNLRAFAVRNGELIFCSRNRHGSPSNSIEYYNLAARENISPGITPHAITTLNALNAPNASNEIRAIDAFDQHLIIHYREGGDAVLKKDSYKEVKAEGRCISTDNPDENGYFGLMRNGFDSDHVVSIYHPEQEKVEEVTLQNIDISIYELYEYSSLILTTTDIYVGCRTRGWAPFIAMYDRGTGQIKNKCKISDRNLSRGFFLKKNGDFLIALLQGQITLSENVFGVDLVLSVYDMNLKLKQTQMLGRGFTENKACIFGNSLFVALVDKSVQIRDIESGSLLKTIATNLEEIDKIAVTDKYMAIAGNRRSSKEVEIWNYETETLIQVIFPELSVAQSYTLSRPVLWTLSTPIQELYFDGTHLVVQATNYQIDESQKLTAANDIIKVWDTTSLPDDMTIMLEPPTAQIEEEVVAPSNPTPPNNSTPPPQQRADNTQEAFSGVC